jgi:hypothetical protein
MRVDSRLAELQKGWMRKMGYRSGYCQLIQPYQLFKGIVINSTHKGLFSCGQFTVQKVSGLVELPELSKNKRFRHPTLADNPTWVGRIWHILISLTLPILTG